VKAVINFSCMNNLFGLQEKQPGILLSLTQRRGLLIHLVENWPTMGAAILLHEWRLSAAGQHFSG
jgi:hypothetical protein